MSQTELKTGDVVHVVKKTRGGNIERRYDSTVTVGRKYFTLNHPFIPKHNPPKFDRFSLREVTDYMETFFIWGSASEYDAICELEKKEQLVRDWFRHLPMTLDQVRKIHDILIPPDDLPAPTPPPNDTPPSP